MGTLQPVEPSRLLQHVTMTTITNMFPPEQATSPAISCSITDAQLAAVDGRLLASSAFEPVGRETRGAVIINSATGVPRRFYRRFATFLATRGFKVVTYDYRGIGESLRGPVAEDLATMQDWGQRDFHSVLQRTLESSNLPVFVVGHSVGGQVPGLTPLSAQVQGYVLVAAQSGHWRHWPRPQRYLMAALWHALVPGLTRACSYLPSKWLGFGENLPPGVAKQWARWCRSPRFFVDDTGAPLQLAFETIRAPLRAYSFSDDPIAPLAAAEALLTFYDRAQVSHRHVTPRELGAKSIGHFGFFRAKLGESFWQDVAAWLTALADQRDEDQSHDHWRTAVRGIEKG